MKSKQSKITTEDLLESAIKEQQFYRIECEYLVSVLSEVKTLTGTLEQAVIQNAIEKHQLNKLIHAKLIFK